MLLGSSNQGEVYGGEEHVASMGDTRNANNILERKSECKRLLWRSSW
jgi:hypothetical protein